MNKYTWNWYTEGDDSKGKTDPRKRAIAWNATVWDIRSGNKIFQGDLDDYRLRQIREDTSIGKEYDPQCILINHERGEPLFVACNGKMYTVNLQSEFKTVHEKKEIEIEELERRIRVLKGEEKDVGEGGLGRLFG